ncbi:MAG: hypothetical protein MAG431_00435 [Chloroflexi bacterium]|nr:hypothetical protein [Chloroflexota bacterium]
MPINYIASNGTLIQRGGGIGPVKPRQPASVYTLEMVPTPTDGFWKMRGLLFVALSSTPEGAISFKSEQVTLFTYWRLFYEHYFYKIP